MNTSDLAAEVARLTAENADLRKRLAQHQFAASSLLGSASWMARLWLGHDLRDATKRLEVAVRNWMGREGELPISEGLQFFSAALSRFTRIGVFRVIVALVIGVSTLWFAIAQVMLLRGQNELVDVQKRTQAADLFVRLQLQGRVVARNRTIVKDSSILVHELSQALDAENIAAAQSLARSPHLQRSTFDSVMDQCILPLNRDGHPADYVARLQSNLESKDLHTARIETARLVAWYKDASQKCEGIYGLFSELLKRATIDMETFGPQK